MNHADVVVAGAGLIGLATALELQSAGCRVSVFDQSEAMSEASRAAAGMLAAEDPENPPQLHELSRLSLDLYPEFLSRIEELSGKKVPIRTTSTVQSVRRLPDDAHALSEDEMRELAPRATTASSHFIFLEEKSFDAWDLAEALPSAARRAGIELREHDAVVGVAASGNGVEVVTAAGTFSAGAFLNAAGAWAPALDRALPVVPRKGHMLTAELPGETQMRCVLRTPNVYIVPRGDHRYTVGPTVEDAGFDRTVHPGRIHELFLRAVDLWPPLRDASIAETWVGFRPGSDDALPIIDRTANPCWVATGHFKNGIMLGPGTGRAISQWILGRQPPVDLSAFRAGRFVSDAVSS